jgi:translocator assembly and maintenance protein 41
MSNDASGQLTSVPKLRDLVHSTFPSNEIVHAFGYGSGVFSQGRDPGMLDLIFVVRDAQAWHQANQARNPGHYAFWLRTMDPQGLFATGIQRTFRHGRDGKVFFHVIENPVPLKYGVIQNEDFIQDLTQWESLYVAGRLHKPILTIPIEGSLPGKYDDELIRQQQQKAQYFNLQAAVATALLLSPLASHNVSWLQFYSQIASLSYTGDFRMAVGGEDPHKIQKLVQTPGQLERFHVLYRDGVENHPTINTNSTSVLNELEGLGLLSIEDQGLQWNPQDVSSRTQLIQQLPPRIQRLLLEPSTSTTSSHGSFNPVEDHSLLQRLQQQQQDTLAKTLTSIVAPAARNQSFKGIFTFGLRKSMIYAATKLSKGLFRKRF